ncbi:flavodoxin family protein [uncultured Friedmanniella sp.]|uniref:flavodoxin family protein n=1 Tax=uncultured Friedmanniella sp. TaxID=335381 RepID=UPI0035CBF6F2
MSHPVRVIVAYHSGFGHTARQAHAVAEGARSLTGTQVELLPVDEPDDELIAALDQADAIIFGAPTYMGAASAVFKTFAEATSKAWGDGLRWQGKVAAGFTNSQNINGNKENTLLEMFVLAAQHGMHWVSLGAYGGWNTTTASPDDLNRLGGFTGAMAQSHGDAGSDQAPPAADLETAAHLGRRVAETTQQLVAGRKALTASPQPSADEQQAYVTATTTA